MKKIRVGIIGFGRMGITHYSIINTHQDVDIVAIADPSSLVLSLLKKYIPGINLYKDYNELLNSGLVDAVLVCTPPSLHYSIARLAGKNGIHVFSEKPFTTRYKDARELAEEFKKNGLVNQVGYVNRHNDVFFKTRTLLDSRIIGDIIRFKSEMFSCTVVKPDDGDGWRSSRENGGGVVFEMASHAIDLVLYLIGKPDKVIGSSLNKIYSKNVEDAISSTLLYKSGLTGTIYVNWSDTSFRKPANKIEIFGTGGKILSDQHSIKVFMNKKNELLGLKEGWNTYYITDIFRPVQFYVRGNEFTRQLYDFIDCILDRKKQCLCTFNDSAMTSEVIDSIFSDFKNSGL